MDSIRECAEVFLEKQGQLYDEKVCNTIEEAIDFLEECCVQIFDSAEELKEYLDEEVDTEGMSIEELLEEVLEVFQTPSGKYFYIEG